MGSHVFILLQLNVILGYCPMVQFDTIFDDKEAKLINPFKKYKDGAVHIIKENKAY
jgi:hypothetical protein